MVWWRCLRFDDDDSSTLGYSASRDQNLSQLTSIMVNNKELEWLSQLLFSILKHFTFLNITATMYFIRKSKALYYLEWEEKYVQNMLRQYGTTSKFKMYSVKEFRWDRQPTSNNYSMVPYYYCKVMAHNERDEQQQYNIENPSSAITQSEL